ncbi:MAG: hypoxanthine phosphoribosyltransferase [Planctomycetaceae bacterium]|nr:hypoxanthine phosphoribosyltransferase [Planctomycetaceae bacterium]
MRQLITADQIETGVTRLAEQIRRDFSGQPLTVLGVLTGSIILMADLIRKLDMPLRVGLVQASSYRGQTTTAGDLKLNPDLLPDLRQRHVLLLDDIFDTGQTLTALVELVQRQQAASVRAAVLLWKEGRSQVTAEPDYHAFRIPDEFVVGYGLDYNDEYRHLPYIAVLEPADLGE